MRVIMHDNVVMTRRKNPLNLNYYFTNSNDVLIVFKRDIYA